MQSPFEFTKHGQSGLEISSLFPHTARFADDLCVIRSMYTDTAAHASGCLQMNTGSVLIGKPSLGSWLSYGLGNENENLPSFVVMTDPRGGPIGSASNWTAGYMPAAYPGHAVPQRTAPRCSTWPPPTAFRARTQRHALDLLKQLNERHLERVPTKSSWPHGSSPTSWPTGCRQPPPRWSTSTRGAPQTRAMYGLDDKRDRRLRPQVPDHPPAARAGRALRPALLRRRPHRRHLGRPQRLHQPTTNCMPARPIKPIAALIADLKRTGLWDETLLIWGGEFGRTPTSEGVGKPGRDHNSHGFSMWLAGAGVKGGQAIGATDELGFNAVEEPVPRLRPARDDPAPDGPRPHQTHLFLLRTEPAAHWAKRQRGRQSSRVMRGRHLFLRHYSVRS